MCVEKPKNISGGNNKILLKNTSLGEKLMHVYRQK